MLARSIGLDPIIFFFYVDVNGVFFIRMWCFESTARMSGLISKLREVPGVLVRKNSW